MLFPEYRQTGLDGLEGTEVSGFELCTGLFLQGAFHGAVDAVSGVADDGVQVAFGLDDLFDDGFCAGAVIDIQYNWDNPFLGTVDGTPAAAGIHFHAGAGQKMGGGGADTAASAGKQNNFYFHNSDRFIKWSGSGMS